MTQANTDREKLKALEEASPTKFTLQVERGLAGLWYITSRDIPKGSLFVAEHSLEAALAAVPKCMDDLANYRKPAGARNE